jgi:hypothetical protein
MPAHYVTPPRGGKQPARLPALAHRYAALRFRSFAVKRIVNSPSGSEVAEDADYVGKARCQIGSRFLDPC